VAAVFLVGLVGLLFGVVVFVLWALYAGLRAGDRPGDAVVTALLAEAGQPDEPRPVIVVRVRNHSEVPLMAGFSASRRARPAWLDGGTAVRVPRRTVRRRFRAEAHDVVGVVAGSGEDGSVAAGSVEARFVVPVPDCYRRYTLTAAIGQSGGRLRVFRVAVAGRSRAGSGGGTFAASRRAGRSRPDGQRSPEHR
jgi:hypothetical protein